MSNVVPLTIPRPDMSTNDGVRLSGPPSSKNAVPLGELANLAGILIDVTDKFGDLLDFLDLLEEVQQSTHQIDVSRQSRTQVENAKRMLTALDGRIVC